MTLVAGNTKAEEFAEIKRKLGMSVPKLAERLGVDPKRAHNWVHLRSNNIPDDVMDRARAMLGQNDVTPPKIPASQLHVPIPYIGGVAASSRADWNDPFDAETFEFVPAEMGDVKGRFACTVVGDSMYDILEQGDVCVFQASITPRIGSVILFRSDDMRVTIKTLKHDGSKFILHAENPSYEDTEARGIAVGFLVGIIRRLGSKIVTVYDPTGIRP